MVNNECDMIFRRTLTLFTFTLVFVATCSFAQEPNGEITGRVVNSRDSEPLALVQLELAGTSIRTVTAADGTFRFAAIPPGSFVLQATTVGYYSNKVEFTLAAGETKIIEIGLTSST